MTVWFKWFKVFQFHLSCPCKCVSFSFVSVVTYFPVSGPVLVFGIFSVSVTVMSNNFLILETSSAKQSQALLKPNTDCMTDRCGGGSSSPIIRGTHTPTHSVLTFCFILSQSTKTPKQGKGRHSICIGSATPVLHLSCNNYYIILCFFLWALKSHLLTEYCS